MCGGPQKKFKQLLSSMNAFKSGDYLLINDFNLSYHTYNCADTHARLEKKKISTREFLVFVTSLQSYEIKLL